MIFFSKEMGNIVTVLYTEILRMHHIEKKYSTTAQKLS